MSIAAAIADLMPMSGLPTPCVTSPTAKATDKTKAKMRRIFSANMTLKITNDGGEY